MKEDVFIQMAKGVRGAGSGKEKVGLLLNEVAMCHNNHTIWYRYWSQGLGTRLCNAASDSPVILYAVQPKWFKS